MSIPERGDFLISKKEYIHFRKVAINKLAKKPVDHSIIKRKSPRLPPTYPQDRLNSKLGDYGEKGSITLGFSGSRGY